MRGVRLNEFTEILSKLKSKDESVVIMAAARKDQASLESADWGHGAFTRALMEGLDDELNGYSGIALAKQVFDDFGASIPDEIQCRETSCENP